MLCFCENIRKSIFFCGHNILTEGVLVIQMSNNVGISVINGWNNRKNNNKRTKAKQQSVTCSLILRTKHHPECTCLPTACI
jgi:hypothetical protein